MTAQPLLLAIETATAASGIALLRGETEIASRALATDRPPSELLLPAILALLEDAHVAIADVEAFAVSVGPGSFTGLRVGVATAKGLAFGGDRLMVAVPTLAALALRADPAPGPIVALLDARRGEVYAAAYDGDLGGAPRFGPVVLRPEALADAIAALDAQAPCTLIGEGVPVVAELLRARFGDALRLVPPPAGRADAVAVGRHGARLLARGAGISADELAPVYVRRAEAEVRRTGERFEASSSALTPPETSRSFGRFIVMEPRDVTLIETLLPTSPELRRLWEEHQRLERELESLRNRRILSSDEEAREREIRKIKLAGRDRIQAILRDAMKA